MDQSFRNAVLHREASRVTITIPPPKAVREIILGVLCLLMPLGCGQWAAEVIWGENPQHVPFVCGLCCGLWAPIWLLLGLLSIPQRIASAWRRTELIVADGRLSMVDYFFSGVTRQEWTREQLGAIVLRSNDIGQAYVGVRTRDGRRFFPSPYCKDSDSRWIATSLAGSLDLPVEPDTLPS